MTNEMKAYAQKLIDEGFERYNLPEYMKQGVENYVFCGVEGGSFLNAILTNNLIETFSYADQNNLTSINQWVRFLYNCVPSPCWGSVEKVNRWMQERSKEREENRKAQNA